MASYLGFHQEEYVTIARVGIGRVEMPAALHPLALEPTNLLAHQRGVLSPRERAAVRCGPLPRHS